MFISQGNGSLLVVLSGNDSENATRSLGNRQLRLQLVKSLKGLDMGACLLCEPHYSLDPCSQVHFPAPVARRCSNDATRSARFAVSIAFRCASKRPTINEASSGAMSPSEAWRFIAAIAFR